jgi:magnesium and cobalt transporter
MLSLSVTGSMGMSDPSSTKESEPRPQRSFPKTLLKRLASRFHAEPASLDDVKNFLRSAHEQRLLNSDAYSVISATLAVADKTAGDVMVPRSRIDMLDISKPLAELLPEIIEAAHSRFPVYENDRDNIIGILLAKDLLLTITNPGIALRTLVRPAVFIPESKRLNVLLHDFRISRNHLALVINEHGGTSGLITMEDVLEQIVGDIEDEHDEEEKATIFETGRNSWRAMGGTSIEAFNRAFETQLPEGEYDTVGGWITSELGHIPKRGDHLAHEGLTLTVVGADAKRVLWLHIQRGAAPSSASPEAG